jgi:single-stranded-DNA-specific exonuclease
MAKLSKGHLREAGVSWILAPEPEPHLVGKIARELEIPEVVVKILVNRGLVDLQAVEAFLNPDLLALSDPYLFKDMSKAVDRIVQALKDQEKIMIYGDYDVDGITATSLVFLVLNKLGAEVSYYLPNRLTEGYGFSREGIEEAKGRGVTLLISVDCGITAREEVEYANQLGIDCILTDHHEPGEILPEALAIINPKTERQPVVGESSDSRRADLAGVGIAFKLSQALYQRLGQDQAEVEEHLDLVALGTVADIVPLMGENRILTKYGINQLARTSKPGLKALIFVSGLLGRPIGTGQIVFMLAPRINAVGRLGNAEKAIRLLTTRNEQQASAIARVLNEENRRRKSIDEQTLEEALELIEQSVDLANDKAIVLAATGWHQGVIGIVASRLVERFHRPTVLIAIEGQEGKGSARSIPGFHLYEALKECEEILLRFGGHKYAAGLCIAADKIDDFRERLKRVSSQLLTSEDLVPKLEIDVEADLFELNEHVVDTLERFAPFGPQNMRPVFLTRGLEVVGQPHIVGNNHLKFKVRKNGAVFDCIGFGFGDYLRWMNMKPAYIEMAYVVERNYWNENVRVQLRVKDIKVM